jgi:uncharacterized protein YuzE
LIANDLDENLRFDYTVSGKVLTLEIYNDD